jgi:hypothetical protein
MSFEEEFDRRIRQKSEELKYPFDEKNWERASAMLDAERKSTSGGFRRLLLPLVTVLLLSLGGVMVLQFSDSHPELASDTRSIESPVSAAAGIKSPGSLTTGADQQANSSGTRLLMYLSLCA